MEKHILKMKAVQADQIRDIQKHGIRRTPLYKHVQGITKEKSRKIRPA